MNNRTSPLTIEVLDRPAPILIDASRTPSGSAGFGFEGGRVLSVNGRLHIFTTELLSEPIWVHTALAHWSSDDGLNWERESTIRTSTGDNTGRDTEAALFAPMPIYSTVDERWQLFFVAYRSEPDQPNQFRRNFGGRVLRSTSTSHGLDGIPGPYAGQNVVLEPNHESQAWEGLQGTDSFFPFLGADGTWLGFYGSCTSEDLARARWGVGLAHAAELTGTWVRDPSNPLETESHFIENPVVQEIYGTLIALYENDPFDPAQARSFGWMTSTDGKAWERQPPIQIPDHTASWASRIRTPLGLVPTENGYRAYFTAFDRRGSDPGAPTHGHIAAIELRIGP